MVLAICANKSYSWFYHLYNSYNTLNLSYDNYPNKINNKKSNIKYLWEAHTNRQATNQPPTSPKTTFPASHKKDGERL